MGVAEQLLAAQHAVVAEHDVLASGQIGELDEALLEPFGVRVLGGERGLDLVVVDDAALRGVDEEHPARLQAALRTTLAGSMSITPTSDAITTRSSSVTQ